MSDPVPPADSPAETATALVEYAWHLRHYGERAPGGDETWAEWDRRAYAWLHVHADAVEAARVMAEVDAERLRLARMASNAWTALVNAGSKRAGYLAALAAFNDEGWDCPSEWETLRADRDRLAEKDKKWFTDYVSLAESLADTENARRSLAARLQAVEALCDEAAFTIAIRMPDGFITYPKVVTVPKLRAALAVPAATEETAARDAARAAAGAALHPPSRTSSSPRSRCTTA